MPTYTVYRQDFPQTGYTSIILVYAGIETYQPEWGAALEQITAPSAVDAGRLAVTHQGLVYPFGEGIHTTGQGIYTIFMKQQRKGIDYSDRGRNQTHPGSH